MTIGVLAVCALLGLYWSVSNPAKDYVLIATGVVGMAIYSPLAAGALALLVGAVWFGLSEPSGVRNLAAVAAIVLGFVAYKLSIDSGPLGTSLSLVGFVFAVPRAIHVLLDARYRGLQRPSFTSLNAYFWFFPLLVIGPIHRLGEFQRSTRRRRLDAQQIGLGLERILVGLASVKLLGDWLVSQRLHAYIDRLSPDRDGLAALLRSVEYGLNLYFKFAGWTAVAIGIAALFGHEVAENFHRPFAQPNISAFWRNWHMTLTRWTTDYVFQPLAAQTRRPAVGIVATMFAIALWHEFSLRYVAWAVWHAGGLVVHRWFERMLAARGYESASGAIGRVASTALTIAFVFLGFTITRVEGLGDAWSEFGAILTGGYR